MAPVPELRHLVRNQSSRNGASPQLIVLHSSESPNRPGRRDLVALGEWFDNPKSLASAHAANDADGNDARYVPDSRKAWSCAGYNAVSLNLEQIGFSSQKEWPEAQLRNTAEWIAYWSELHGIPLQRGRVANGAVVKPGVVMHSELGVIGGNHHDPGPDYPIDRVMALAVRATPDIRKQLIWQDHLTTARAQLKSLLALRAQMRQHKLENSVAYKRSTRDFRAVRDRIMRLKRLVRR
jgi:N-acetyl-anhydromuramyl-L-alanine amidase AmpD